MSISKSELENAARCFESFGGEFVGYDESENVCQIKFESTKRMLVLIDQLKKNRVGKFLSINSKIIDGVQHMTIGRR